MVLGTLLGGAHAFASDGGVPWDELDLEVPWNGHQGRLDLVVLDVIGIWRLSLTCDDLVRGQNANKSGVQKSRGDELTRTSTRPSAKAKMRQTRRHGLSRRVECLEPSLRVELASIAAEMVDIY